MYDQRLFNQEGGMGHGLTSDDAYNLYDKPMFADRGTGLHRAKAAADDEEGGEAGSTLASSLKGTWHLLKDSQLSCITLKHPAARLNILEAHCV
jgi:hypothetical protein